MLRGMMETTRGVGVGVVVTTLGVFFGWNQRVWRTVQSTLEVGDVAEAEILRSAGVVITQENQPHLESQESTRFDQLLTTRARLGFNRSLFHVDGYVQSRRVMILSGVSLSDIFFADAILAARNYKAALDGMMK
jgi:hypothetical protein